MKKFNLTLIIALLYVSFSFAQRVNLDREYLSVSHIYLPSAPILDESLRTYIVDANVKDEYEKDELLKHLKVMPERFSPNVIMRPLYQEVILPNLCYVGGGGELAYWLELKDYFVSVHTATNW